MPTLGLQLFSVEMTFPFSFLQELSMATCNNDKFYASHLNKEHCVLEVNRTESNIDNDILLTIRFHSKLPANQTGKPGHTRWHFSNISNCSDEEFKNFVDRDKEESTSLIDNDQTSTIQKRKRGRPKNSTKPKSTQTQQLNKDFIDDSVGRYSLRGVKIPSKLIKFELDNGDGRNFESDSDNQDDTETKSVTNNTDTHVDQEKEVKATKMSSLQNCHITDVNIKEDKQIKEMQNNSEIAETTVIDPTAKEKELEHDSDTQMNIICFLCQAKPTFQTKRELRTHEKTFHGDLLCHVCENPNKKYKHIQSLKAHVLTMHGENSNEQPNMCHLCPSRFKFASSLKHHIEEIHEKIQRAKCDIFEKQFYNHSQLRRHQKIHGNKEMKLKCNVCGKGFWHTSNLQRHKRYIHSSRTQYFHCSYCGREFNYKAGLISHIQRNHLNLAVFHCELCTASFLRSKDFKHHMCTIHDQLNFKVTNHRQRYKYDRSPENMLQCSQCLKQFCYKAELIEHNYTEHADTFPFQCLRCSQGFLQQTYLNRHRKITHQDVLTEEEELSLKLSEESYVTGVSGEDDGMPVVEYIEAVEEGDYLSNEDQVTFITEDQEYVTVVSSSQNQNEQETCFDGNENITYVTSYNYENVEEVATSDIKLINSSNEIVTSGTEPMMIDVEGEGQTVRYLIQPSEDGQSRTIGSDEIAKLLMAAKHVSDNTDHLTVDESTEVEINSAQEVEIQTMHS